jgi:hypothetical protein
MLLGSSTNKSLAQSKRVRGACIYAFLPAPLHTCLPPPAPLLSLPPPPPPEPRKTPSTAGIWVGEQVAAFHRYHSHLSLYAQKNRLRPPPALGAQAVLRCSAIGAQAVLLGSPILFRVCSC